MTKESTQGIRKSGNENFIKNSGNIMGKRIQKKQIENLQEFVTVTFVENFDQALRYESLLKANDIPVFVKKHDDPRSLAVMVPEDFIDEAHVVIESQDSYEDFYDLVLDEDEHDDYFDSDFDDNF